MMDLERKMLLLKDLHEGPVTLVFLKNDQTVRKMVCTLESRALPSRIVAEENSDEEKEKRKKNDDVCAVWDTEKGAWRSFRWDSVIGWATTAHATVEVI